MYELIKVYPKGTFFGVTPERTLTVVENARKGKSDKATIDEMMRDLAEQCNSIEELVAMAYWLGHWQGSQKGL